MATRRDIIFLLEVSQEARQSADAFEQETEPRYESMVEDSYTIAYYAEKIAKYLSESPDSIDGTAHTTVLLALEVMNAIRNESMRQADNGKATVH
jgi:PBP1b-binding outer membrane lipoprotein LpoB